MGNDQSSPSASKQEHQVDTAVAAMTAAAELASIAKGGDGNPTKKSEVESAPTEETPSATTTNLEEEEAVLVDGPALVESEDDFSEEEEEESLGDDDSEEEEEEEEDEEYDEFLLERLRILRDAASLKNVAAHFLHPEAPVSSSGPERFGRNYFDRPSAPEGLDAEEADEIALALEDAEKLKNTAKDYAHPEEPVVVSDSTATARCYFDRPSAPERLDLEEAEEIAWSLSDAQKLGKLAADYAHPEAPVATTDPFVKGRNYFSRPSAEPYEEEDVDADRDDVLEDMAALKRAAFRYLHPEAPVVSRPECFGRNYFGRASAPETEDEEIDAERDEVLEDAAELKKLAVMHAHPERPVVSSPEVFGRNYFSRASAPDVEDKDEAEERAAALADAAGLKRLAADFAHPEVGVKTSDATAFGRNYYSRPSADPYEEEEVDADRDDVLEDALALKKLAEDYLRPEAPVTAGPEVFGRNFFSRPSAPDTEEDGVGAEGDEVLEDALALKELASDFGRPEKPVEADPAALGRGYFDRASAPDQENEAEAEERAAALTDAATLKKLAEDYAHPEAGVETSDAAAFGRNYFSRPSAEPYEEGDTGADRDDVLGDAAALKKLAEDFMHPEAPVRASPECFGRNYFSRASAPDTEGEEIDAERNEVLEDVLALKKHAKDFAHPEKPVDVDPAAFGRNYFGRASAPGQEDDSEAEERASALADAARLKKLAVDYAHPEVGVTTSDATAFGRNYFSRPSAEPYEEEEVDADRDDVLEDVAALRKLAKDYAHPEAPVSSSPEVFGRNYFNRASAPETEEEDIDTRDEVLEDVLALKKLAVDFSHPEKPVEVDPAAFGRNYFGRASAPQEEGLEDSEERAAALADAARLKELAVGYAHPEVGVKTTDSVAFGRNYFSRPSAEPYEEEDTDADRDDMLEDVLALKKLAADYAHPETPVSSSPEVFGRNYFNRASAPETEEEEVDAERDEVLEDVLALEKLAVDFAHPEKPVEVDPAAFGRNYFTRASAPQQEDEDGTDERAAALEDAARLRKLAADYQHPEAGVTTSDPAAFGRSYFSRPSAPRREDEEAASALRDAAQLGKLAKDFAHPELPADSGDPAAMGRCYYSRYSSPAHDDSLISARSTLKAGAAPQAAAPLGGEGEQQQQNKGKTKQDEGDLPRTSSSHMLFGMAKAS